MNDETMSEPTKARRPVAMTEDPSGGIAVLCDDGTVWFTRHDVEREGGTPLGPMVPCNHRWVQLPHGPIPGTPAALEQEGSE